MRLARIIPLAIVCVLWWAACIADASPVRPAVERVDAVLGQPLLVPVAVNDPAVLVRPGAVRIRLDDGQEPPVAFFRIDSAGRTEAGWIGRVAQYRAVSASEALRAGAANAGTPGVWYAEIALPLEAVSQGIWFGETRWEINWLPDPERAALESAGRPLWASPVPPEAADSPDLIAALDAVDADPFQRWRVRLVRDGLAPRGAADRTDAGGTDLSALRADLGADPGERLLDAIARHHEARWQLILGRLALVDPDAAARLRRRLGGVAMIDGRWLPAWTPDSPTLRSLQADLLSPFVDDRTRVLRALGWLDAQPKAVAWVVDDAGAPGQDEGRLTATIGVLSLPALETPLMVQVSGALEGPVLVTVPARIAARVHTGVPMLGPRGRSTETRTVTVPVRVGRSDTQAETLGAVPSAAPPGLPIGPLLANWTMESLLAGEVGLDAQPSVPGATVSGSLRRAGPPGRGSVSTGWRVFLRCASPADQTAGVPDAVTIWTGPFGLPRAVWRVSRDGTVQRLFGSGSLAGVRVVETAEGWALDAELPPDAADEDDILRLGLTRELGETRASWPRRMTPGQDEPGRMPVDLRRWSGF